MNLILHDIYSHWQINSFPPVDFRPRCACIGIGMSDTIGPFAFPFPDRRDPFGSASRDVP
jgi:hypothetical protein